MSDIEPTFGPSAYELIGAALDRAITIVESELPERLGTAYDWRTDAALLCTSNAFTVRQAAAIVGRNPAYVANHIRSELGRNKREGKTRAMTGVSGKLNLKSLNAIRALRIRYASIGEIDNLSKAHLAALVNDGNGIAVVCHLIGADPKKTRRALQYFKENKNV